MSSRLSRLAGLALMLAATLPSIAIAQDIERFIGRFEGKTLSAASDEVSPRDITVTIDRGEDEDEFVLEWTLVSQRASGKLKRKQYRIRFARTRREGIFKSMMRTDMFGNQRPLDPLKGEPYFWARIDGDTLTVYTLLITDEGGYEMQTARRTLVEGGMELLFTRVRDDQVMRTVTGKLNKVR